MVSGLIIAHNSRDVFQPMYFNIYVFQVVSGSGIEGSLLVSVE